MYWQASQRAKRLEPGFAPAASRNEAGILAVLADHLPESGRALELASGTGQHVTACARQHPGIRWQPSEIEESRIGSIRQWVDSAGLQNLLPPIRLDATRAPYPRAPYDAILLVSPERTDDAALRMVLEPIIGAIDVDSMREANYAVDRDQDKMTPEKAARLLAKRIGI